MSREKQIEMIKKELEFLEEIARKDSSLKPPVVDDDSTFFEEKVRAIFSDDPEYWEKKQLPGHRVAFDDPMYITDLKAIRLRQKNKEETWEERVSRNKENYFSRAKEAVFLTEIGIVYAKEGNFTDAIDALKKAYKEYPLGQSNELLATLCFNLGKTYFERGDAELGVYYLSKYCGIQSDGDYYKSVLEQFLKLEYKNVSGNQILKGGTIGGKNFKYSKSKVSFRQPVKLPNPNIDLTYKIPYNLELEFIDKEEIILLDYQYLIMIDRPSTESVFYEMKLPLNKFSFFMKEFYGTLIEYGIRIEELNDFNTLYTELFVAEKLLGSLKYYENQELKAIQTMKSIALLEVSAQKAEQVIDDYKRFLSLFVLEQRTDEELDQIEIAKVKKVFDRKTSFFLMQEYGEFHAEYKHHLKVMDEYAHYRVCLYNLEQGIPNPFNTENKEEYEKAKIYYWSLLDGVFSMYEKDSAAKEEHIFANLTVQNQLLKKLILTQWKIINEILLVDPPSALQKSRTLIEGVVNEIFHSKGYSFKGKDGDVLDLKEKCDRIDWALDNKTRQKLDKLRFKGNSCSHYAEIKENYFGHLEPISKEQAVQYIKYLEEVITFLVNRFHL